MRLLYLHLPGLPFERMKDFHNMGWLLIEFIGGKLQLIDSQGLKLA